MLTVGIVEKIKTVIFSNRLVLNNYNIYPSVGELNRMWTSEMNTLYLYCLLHPREHQ